jgi:radical SAM protein with 4Fe4S-binding SPASM domain
MLKEIIFILKKTNLKKIGNALHLYVGYFLSLLFKLPKRSAYPIGLSVEPIPLCNLHCPECPTGMHQLDRTGGKIDFELFKKTIDELAPFLFQLNLYFQGEPFLNDEIYKLMDYAASEKNIYTVTSTNGHFLSPENCEKIVESGLDKIIISLDGATQDVYERYRIGGNYEKVISGIKTLVEVRSKLKSKKPLIAIQFIVFKFNEHQIGTIKALSKELKVDKLELKSAQVYDFETDDYYIPTLRHHARYKKNNQGIYQIKNKLKNKCLRLFESSVITSAGDVLPCCFDKNAEHTYGNITVNSFKTTQNSTKAKNFRAHVLKNRKEIEICKNCTSGLYK